MENLLNAIDTAVNALTEVKNVILEAATAPDKEPTPEVPEAPVETPAPIEGQAQVGGAEAPINSDVTTPSQPEASAPEAEAPFTPEAE